MVIISAGAFMMGSDQGQENEQPCHRVWLDDFGIGRYPVTNQDYAVFLESANRRRLFGRDSKFSAPEQPVVGVTWDEAVAFCVWLSGAKRKTVSLADGGRVGAGGAGRTRWRELPVGRPTALGAIRRRLRFT